MFQQHFDHEQVEVFQDTHTGLRGIIAVHSTVLGPACGGLRLARYATLDAGVADALDLSRAMTLKNSAAGLDLGGGKSVLIDDGLWDHDGVRHSRMRAFGDQLERLEGRYITAEDVGTTPEDMQAIAEASGYVTGLPGRSGDPSAATARTVFDALIVGVQLRLGRGLEGVWIGVIGVGHVGSRLAARLRTAGAEVSVTDIDIGRAQAVAREIGANALPLDGFLEREFDVLAPCAMGGLITEGLVPSISARVICGAANNPLADWDAALSLHRAKILYVPDFLANCGGIIHVGADVLGFDPEEVNRRIAAAADRVRVVLEEAQRTGELPVDVARRLATERLRAHDH